MEIQELKTNFVGRGQVKGFIFTQVNKRNCGYIYKVETNSGTHYEVFKRKINTKFNCISYPSDKQFGISAWCCSSYERALFILDELGEA